MITFVDVILDLASKDNTDTYVIGSNSKLLSTDIITEFRDRHVYCLISCCVILNNYKCWLHKLFYFTLCN